VAVAVEEGQFVVLDDEFRIVEVGAAARATFGPLLGQAVFDAFPDSEPLFRPYYERARATGATVEFGTYYDGYAIHLRLTPRGSHLVVGWNTLVRLDLLTLEGLLTSLDTALDAIAELERAVEHDLRRAHLRVVEGAA
jgi:hypothetical protein